MQMPKVGYLQSTTIGEESRSHAEIYFDSARDHIEKS